MKKRLVIFLSIICVCSFLFACGNNRNKIKDLKVSFVEEEWTTQKGEWTFEDKVLTSTSSGNSNRIILSRPLEQELLDVQVDVKILKNGLEGGIEFRGDETFSSLTKTNYVVNKDISKAGINLITSNRNISDREYIKFKDDEWYRLRVVLDGVNGKFYLNNDLLIERSDISLKQDSLYLALVASGEGVSFRNFVINGKEEKTYSWDEIVASSNIIRSGYERYNSSKFEYIYAGLGKTTMLVSPYGFTTPNAPRPGQTSYVYNNTPALIYDYWWDGTRKVTPFKFGGGYLSGRRILEGEILDDEETSYYQHVNILNGVITTKLKLKVQDEIVTSTREMAIDDSGVVAYKVTNSKNSKFVFTVGTETGFRGEIKKIDGGIQVSSQLLTDSNNFGFLTVLVSSKSGYEIDEENGQITFNATDKPLYIYLSPSSTLDEKENAKEKSESRCMEGLNRGYDSFVSKLSEIYKDIYSRSQISIPDLGMGIWYLRSLYYMAVSMYNTRVPVGCYGSNPDGFFGDVCFEFDIMFQQLAMLYLNQTELSKTTTNWVESIKGRARELASTGYSDRYGNSLPELIEDGYLITWLMGYDGTPTHGDYVGHERGWMSLFSGTNAAISEILQAEYTDGDIENAKDTLIGQLRVLMSFMV